MRAFDESNLPHSPGYKDRGGMYFPDLALLPFIRSVDTVKMQIMLDLNGMERTWLQW